MKAPKDRSQNLKEERDIREEYERMTYVMKALGGGGIWDLNVLTGDLICDRRWHEILGLNYDSQRVGSVGQFRAYIHPDDVDRATKIDLKQVRRAIARDERYFIEFRIIRQDGAIRWIRSVASLIGDAGKDLRAVGCITDITPILELHPTFQSELELPNRTSEHQPSSSDHRPSKDHTQKSFLSIHERECLRWVTMGKTARETALILGKSPRTIEFHLNRAVAKLNAANKVQAAIIAIEKKFI
jgi:PAS domain S-box-containing protein